MTPKLWLAHINPRPIFACV